MRRVPLIAALLLLLATPAAHAKVIFVTTGSDVVDTGGVCSLRDAVRSANDDLPRGGCATGEGDDEIQIGLASVTLSRTGKYDDLALSGDLDVRTGGGALTVYGAPGGTTIDAAGVDRVFEADVPLTLQNLTLRGGRPGQDNTGGVNVKKTWGGAVLARAALTVSRVTFDDNRTADGVGSVSLTGLDGGYGGAIAIDGSVNSPSVVISDSVLTGNRTGDGAPRPGGGTSAGGGGEGGALFTSTSGAVTIADSRFTGNRTGAAGTGGGPTAYGGFGSATYSFSAALTITNSIIAANVVGAGASSVSAAAVNGGTLRHVTLAGNTADGVPLSGTATAVYDVAIGDSVVAGEGLQCYDADDLGSNVSPAGSGCPGAGTDPGLDAALIPAADSRAIDHATGVCPAADVRAVTRPQGAACDSGAIERRPTSLTLTPGSLLFGTQQPGTLSAAQPIQLSYSGDGAFRPGAVSTSGDFTAAGCAAAVFVDSGSCSIDVTFAPSVSGPRTGLLTIATPAGPRSAPLNGIGSSLSAPGVPGPSPGSAKPAAAVTRSVLGPIRFVRIAGRPQVQVTVSCPARGTRCADTLRIRLTRKGRRSVSTSYRVEIEPGVRVVKALVLPRAFAAGLRRRGAVSVRAQLVKAGAKTLERRVTRRAP